MTGVDTRTDDPLAAVRTALLAEARADAARVLAAADGDTAAVLAQAAEEAATIRAEARARGEADAAGVLVNERARARREARAALLGAERGAYEELRRRVRAAAASLREDPGYPTLRDRLTARARAVLGDRATVTDHPAGGVVAAAGGRRVAYSFDVLADRAVEDLGPDLARLWSP